jgi:CRISPR-associated protein Cmr5
MKHNDVARLRADHALDEIEAYCAKEANVRLAYLSYIKSLPATIRSNGLGQALAMLLARGGQSSDAGQGGNAPAAYRHLYDHVERWFQSDQCMHSDRVAELTRAAGSSGKPLLKAVTAATQHDYLLMQTEALLYAEWLKKFANAFLSAEAEQAGPRR